MSVGKHVGKWVPLLVVNFTIGINFNHFLQGKLNYKTLSESVLTKANIQRICTWNS